MATKAALPFAEVITALGAQNPAVLIGGGLIVLGLAGLGLGFSSLSTAEAQQEQAAAPAASVAAVRKTENAVLVLGAGGRLGRAVVKKLVEGTHTRVV